MQVRDGYKTFRSNKFSEQEELFKKLGSGQSPETLFITCSDSRIDPNLVTQTLPGELFVIRNAGNLVPTRKASGVAATLEYGVKALKVKHIVVCGHSHCGAVSAALAPESLGDLPYVASWLDESGPSLPELPEENTLNVAIEHNVRAQLANLRSLPFVAEAIEAGTLEIHGWVYDFESGDVRALCHDKDCFESIAPSAATA